MPITISALDTDQVRHYQNGGADSYGNTPEVQTSNGGGNPCRHCLGLIPEGADMLVLSHRPFPSQQPYAETGPIFLCAEECDRHTSQQKPEILVCSPDYLVKGYSVDDRIVYGSGKIVDAADIELACEEIFQDKRIRYIHVRSSRNNCYQARIDRADQS